MTVTLPIPRTARAAAPVEVAVRTRRRAWRWLLLLAVAQTALAYRPGLNRRPFIDEGLYVYMGHRMIDHLLHGSFLHEYPGSFFSGAPGFYPVLAALGDSVAGLQGARAVSLLGVIAATVCVFGLGRALFGEPAGLAAAVSFAVCGSVIYQSHLAVYDSTMMAFVAGAAWLAVVSVRRDGLALAPVVGGLLALAFLAKYAGAVYAPVVALLAAAVGWQQLRWLAVRRAAYLVLSGTVITLFVLVLWGHSLWPGIVTTTTERRVLQPAAAGHLLAEAAEWVGPWLVLAVLGGLFRLRREWTVVLVLLGGSVVGAAQQIHIGDSTSLNKHVAFGLVFACPLIGDLAARTLRRPRWLGVPAVTVVLALLLGSGLQHSQRWLTGWVEDGGLLPPLRAAIALNPDKTILAEEGAPERYALRTELDPRQYNDTYALRYQGLTGDAAYRRAISDTHYGVIYLTLRTPTGRRLHDWLRTGETPYRQVAQVDRVLRGEVVGQWLIYVPKVSS